MAAYNFAAEKLRQWSAQELAPELLVSGDDLIAMGLAPGPLFKEILTKVEDEQLEGRLTTRQQALDFTKERYPEMKALAVLLLALNLNTATPQQLEALPGIGPVLAKRIVEFREKKGGYKRMEELLAIPGISEKKWKVLRDLLTVQ